MNLIFSDIPEAIENTLIIAKLCSYRPIPTVPTLPNFSTKEKSENDILKENAQTALIKRLDFKFELENKMKKNITIYFC